MNNEFSFLSTKHTYMYTYFDYPNKIYNGDQGAMRQLIYRRVCIFSTHVIHEVTVSTTAGDN